MPRSDRSGFTLISATVVAIATVTMLQAQQGTGQREAAKPPEEIKSAMNNPYRMIENWPRLAPNMKWGAAIGIIPDGKGGAWMHFRGEPPIVHFDAAGNMVKSFGEGLIVQAHGFCMDRDGNLWAGDNPFGDNPAEKGKGFQFFKFSPDGKLLLTLGKAGVAKASEDTFVGPNACTIAPNGDIVIADGHVPRPSHAQQDGDRIVRFTKDGKFVGTWGKQGSGPGEFWGPHALAYDSQGRLFVADRSNNRVQILDKDMKYVDEWRHFGRPSGIAILKDDTLIVSDSESNRGKDPKTGTVRNPGWQSGIRIGSAKDGSLKYFIANTKPEGLAADESGNIFGGLTIECEFSKSGGCLQKWVKKAGSGNGSK
jgi:sugar lactone lactonase YvrE